MILTIMSRDDLQQYLDEIDAATVLAMEEFATAPTPREALRRMKFEQIGRHPIEKGRRLNLIEQVNQTFTYLVALKATEWLLDRHPESGGFRLAPGAVMALPFDIMSVNEGLVDAETFAATHPGSNGKLVKDLAKLGGSTARHRYAFFYAPAFPAGRVEKLERMTGVEVHCVDI